MRIFSLAIAAGWLFRSSLSASQQTPFSTTKDDNGSDGVINDELRAFIKDAMEQFGVRGITLGVVKNGVVELEGFGVRNEDGDPVTPDVSRANQSVEPQF